ncbi:MAG: GIY-YIG nuclease family protein [Clostridia bacterium]|nr:GIY-YIG nuclease family protein [Clostridia bacterium]
MKNYYVYILTNKNNSVLYVGITNNIERRTMAHVFFEENSFCAKYNINKLVYVEQYLSSYDAISREKQLKHWGRKAKEKLINSINPEWRDLLKND